MSQDDTGPGAASLSIAAVERETGLAKGSLRVWEKRYGFPQPLRDDAGDRLYPPEQVHRLKLIGRLLDAGQRPGKVVGLGSAELQALIDQSAAVAQATAAQAAVQATPGTGHHAPCLESFLAQIGGHDPHALRYALNHALLSRGLTAFVTELVAPLTSAVGQAWLQGRFEVFEEHLYTEVITGVLRHAIATLALSPVRRRPTVLLTTVPQEPHSLGLLMVEALLALEGCTCISLGTQTPLGDIVQAAQAHRADVVALSFTNLQGAAQVLASLAGLRSQLPARTLLWVGGACTALAQKPLEGIAIEQSLSGLPALVAQWRQTHLPQSPQPQPQPQP